MYWTAQGRLWYASLAADALQLAAGDGAYEELAAQVGSTPSQDLVVIDKDIGRTFPSEAAFQTAEARKSLRRVLGAYALRSTYCQGMSYIAALMLQHLPEREAFWSLAALVEEFLPAGYFTDDLQGAYMDQFIAFGVFLPHRCPRLAAHLAKLEFPLTLIGVRWFLCLFAADLAPAHTCRVWDVLFAHGSHILFGLALELLAAEEEEMLRAADVPDLFTKVRGTCARSTPSWDRLLQVAQARRDPGSHSLSTRFTYEGGHSSAGLPKRVRRRRRPSRIPSTEPAARAPRGRGRGRRGIAARGGGRY
jgi:hypothetical protein